MCATLGAEPLGLLDHNFSELPKEFRITILEGAPKFPRTVTITEYGPIKRIGDTGPYSIKMRSLRAVWQPSALLQVNRESREEGLRKYVGLLTFFESGKPVWFNFESVWLCFDTLGAMRKLFNMEIPRVLPRRRALNRPSFPFSPSSSNLIGRELNLVMMSLRKLMFQDKNGDGGTHIHNFLWKWKMLEKVVFSIPTFEAIGTAIDAKWDPEFRLWFKVERLDAYKSRRRALEMMKKVEIIGEIIFRKFQA